MRTAQLDKLTLPSDNIIKFSGPEEAWMWYCRIELNKAENPGYTPAVGNPIKRPCSANDLFITMQKCIGKEEEHSRLERREMLTPRMVQVLGLPLGYKTLDFRMDSQEIALFDMAMAILGKTFYEKGFTDCA